MTRLLWFYYSFSALGSACRRRGFHHKVVFPAQRLSHGSDFVPPDTWAKGGGMETTVRFMPVNVLVGSNYAMRTNGAPPRVALSIRPPPPTFEVGE
jgi:hypothetical protein